MNFISDQIFSRFAAMVLEEHVFGPDELDRASNPLTDKDRRAIEEGKRIDVRMSELCSISGKGGPGHEEWANISLLDHMISVARGGAVMAEQDLRAADPDMIEADLARDLAMVMVIGFLHDTDKVLSRSRLDKITAAQIEDVINRFGIHRFLRAYDAEIDAELMSALIDAVEVSRAGRIANGGAALSPRERMLAGYARLADRMEGALLKDGPHAALAELKAFGGLRDASFRDGLEIIDIYEPQVPFILEELLTGLSSAVKGVTGLPPVFEAHQDGRLVVVIPAAHRDEIVAAALEWVRRQFASKPRVDVNTRNYVNILEAHTKLEDLFAALESDARTRSKTLVLSKSFAGDDDATTTLRAELSAHGVNLLIPDARLAPGASVMPDIPEQASPSAARIFLTASVIATVLKCSEPRTKSLAKTTLTPTQREADLKEMLEKSETDFPLWVWEIDHDLTRHSVAALVLAALASKDEALASNLLGAEGLLGDWLDGDDDWTGINARFPQDETARFIEPISQMLHERLEGRFSPCNETAPHRCHFTGRPVGPESLFAKMDEGVYGLRISAFSGREGRPESFKSASAKGTYLSGLARAEHSLRYRLAPRASDTVSFHVSSPATVGLFSTLIMENMRDALDISSYELRKRDPRKLSGPAYGKVSAMRRKTLVGRFEEAENKLSDAIDTVLRLVEASIRTDRPVHVFQGLPHHVKDRVYFDALPIEIERALGKRGFRIEELFDLRRDLHLWATVAKTPGLGVGLCTQIMDPDTKLPAICEGLMRIDRMNDPKLADIRHALATKIKDMMMIKNSKDPIVRFACAMSSYQQRNNRDTSNARAERGMRMAIKALEGGLRNQPQVDREALVCGVMAAIQAAFDRDGTPLYAKRLDGDPSKIEALTRAAEIFADEVIPQSFGGRDPDSRTVSRAIGVYRIAFDRAHALRAKGTIVFPS